MAAGTEIKIPSIAARKIAMTVPLNFSNSAFPQLSRRLLPRLS
jgi:hypothetical protein